MRSEASSALLESIASRVRAHAPRRPASGPALRYRAATVLALTAALLVAAAAAGGLSYAATATDNTATAIAHVFSTTRLQHDTASQSTPTSAGISNGKNDNDNGKGDQDGDNPAGHQYVKFEYVCVAVPNPGKHHHKHRVKHITLLLPKPAADRLIDEGIAKRGPC